MAAAGAIAALVCLRWTGSTEAEVGPGRVELSAALAGSGQTTVELPPLGRIHADTHRAPLAVRARVLSVDVEATQSAIQGREPLDALQADITEDLPGAFTAWVRHTLLFAAGTGAVAGLLLPGRGRWHAIPGAVGGVGAVAILLVATWAPYDLDAFSEPTLEGELVRAPGLIQAAERNLGDLETIRSRVDTLSDRLAELYAASVDELPSEHADQVSILHVSDIHLNPLAAELVVDLARDFAVDAVIDTGDVTTFGLSAEARIGEILGRTPVPYLLVPGNHDSIASRTELDALPNITVVDGTVVTVEGVRILGVADPTFTASNEVGTSEANERKRELADAVRRLVEREEPDVLAVHDARQAEAAVGSVPLVIAGHTHERSAAEKDGTRVLTVGSTGATGLGAFTVETDLTYEAQILRFVDGRLVAVDYLSVVGIGGGFVLDRTLIDSADVAEDDAALRLGVEEGGLWWHPLTPVRGGLDLGHRGRAQEHAELRPP